MSVYRKYIGHLHVHDADLANSRIWHFVKYLFMTYCWKTKLTKDLMKIEDL